MHNLREEFKLYDINSFQTFTTSAAVKLSTFLLIINFMPLHRKIVLFINIMLAVCKEIQSLGVSGKEGNVTPINPFTLVIFFHYTKQSVSAILNF